MPSLDLGVAALSNEDGAASRFTDIAAAFAYDWYALGAGEAHAAADKRMAALVKDLADERTALAKAKTDAARPLALALPLSSYAGRYCSAEWGTLRIAPAGDGLQILLGRLHARAEAGSEANSLAAELLPAQRLTFRFSITAGKVTKISGFGATFDRC